MKFVEYAVHVHRHVNTFRKFLKGSEGPSWRDCMVVGFTTTYAISAYDTTKIVSSNAVHDEVYSIQHYVIKFASDFRQFSDFLRVFRYPQPVKLTVTIYLKYC